MVSSSQVDRAIFCTACGNFLFNGTDGSCGRVGVTEGGRGGDACFDFTCTGLVVIADDSGAGVDSGAGEASDDAVVDRPA